MQKIEGGFAGPVNLRANTLNPLGGPLSCPRSPLISGRSGYARSPPCFSPNSIGETGERSPALDRKKKKKKSCPGWRELKRRALRRLEWKGRKDDKRPGVVENRR
ncbi:hypothetical protein TNCV_2708071 [Trichonephila clavipes]|nr:hypothetical protein TNCV_2708071 [Trichonephila clavipes]